MDKTILRLITTRALSALITFSWTYLALVDPPSVDLADVNADPLVTEIDLARLDKESRYEVGVKARLLDQHIHQQGFSTDWMLVRPTLGMIKDDETSYEQITSILNFARAGINRGMGLGTGDIDDPVANTLQTFSERLGRKTVNRLISASRFARQVPGATAIWSVGEGLLVAGREEYSKLDIPMEISALKTLNNYSQLPIPLHREGDFGDSTAIYESLALKAISDLDRAGRIVLEQFGIDLRKPLQELRKENSRLFRYMEDRRILVPVGGSLLPNPEAKNDSSRSTSDIVKLHDKTMSNLRRKNRQWMKRLATVDALPPKSLEEQMRLLRQKQNDKQRLLHEVKLGREVASFFSSALKEIDPRAGAALEMSGNSAFNIAECVIQHGVESAAFPPLLLKNISKLIFGLVGLFGGGPSTDEIILEQLQKVRKEIQTLRQEVQLEFGILRRDLVLLTDKVLGRIDSLELSLRSHIFELREIIGQTAAMVKSLGSELNINQYELREWLSEIQNTDVENNIEFWMHRPFEDLSKETPADSILRSEFEKAVAFLYTHAAKHASNRLLSGGEKRISSVYGTSQATLQHGSGGKFVGLAESPLGIWQDVNTFVNIAAVTGVEFFPKASRINDLDRSRLVNAKYWREYALTLLKLAQRNSQAFRDFANGEERLAILYIRGEDIRRATQAFVKNVDGKIEKRVFQRVIEMMLYSIERYEMTLLSHGKEINTELNGVDIFQGLKSEPRSGLLNVTVIKCSDRLIRKSRKSRDRPTAENLTFTAIPRLMLEKNKNKTKKNEKNENEQELLERLIPAPFRLLAQADQETHIRFECDDMGYLNQREEYRNKGIWINGVFHYGQPFVVIRASLNNRVDSMPIFQKRIRLNEIRFAESDLEYFGDKKHRNCETRLVAHKIPYFGRPVTKDGKTAYELGYETIHRKMALLPRKALILLHEHIQNNWPEIKRSLFNGQSEDLASKQTAQSKKIAEKMFLSIVNQRLHEFNLQTRSEVSTGLGELGDAVNDLYGAQLMLVRFVELALPGLNSDAELQQMLMGTKSPLNFHDLMSSLNTKKDTKSTSFVAIGENGIKYVPQAVTMRARTLELQSKLLSTLHDNLPNPATHWMIDDVLLQLAVFSESNGDFLHREFYRLGVEAPSNWVLNQYANMLSGDEE